MTNDGPPGPPSRPPSVDRLAREIVALGQPFPMAVAAARDAIARGTWTDVDAIAGDLDRRQLQRVINATGVLLHTNLGRAPWAYAHEGFSANLEFDLGTGDRGHRDAAVAAKFAALTGADDATVVNNGAAAVMLVIAALASGSPVAVSRGELIEIGGGFRIPDVMAQSGATLVEVGTTNRTHRSDYERAVIDAGATLIMLVHRSNFEMTGFTSSVSAREVADLGVPVVVDLGSGLLDETCPWLDSPPPEVLRGEPAVRQTLARGADLVVFSGDKLLGGPQAGVIAGRADLVERCRRHPLARVVRCGGLVLGALDAVADRYLDGAADTIPVWSMMARTPEALRRRAQLLLDQLGAAGSSVSIVDSDAVLGGGTLAGRTIASVALGLDGDVSGALRNGPVPVIARVHEGRTLIDLRSVQPIEDPDLLRTLRSVLPTVHGSDPDRAP